jgi:CTP synthase (UTP-ammonia lyase)
MQLAVIEFARNVVGMKGAANLDDIKQQLRACYFPVLMIGGSAVTEEPGEA